MTWHHGLHSFSADRVLHTIATFYLHSTTTTTTTISSTPKPHTIDSFPHPSSVVALRCVGEKERAMALLVNMVAARFSYSPSMERLTKTENPISLSPPTKRSTASVVRAEANQPINPVIRKEEAKVVDSVLVAELSKPLTAYCRWFESQWELRSVFSVFDDPMFLLFSILLLCWWYGYRCWRSGTFPLCDGSHVKHNKATGDNVGPLLVKKQE